MAKAQVELVTGFIGSGKTTWLNCYLKLTAVTREKIVILQLEEGQEPIKKMDKGPADIISLIRKPEDFTVSLLNHILVLYDPDRLIIECNGMQPVNEILRLLNQPVRRKHAELTAVFHLAEAQSYSIYWNNLKPFLEPALRQSHMIVVTKSHLINKERRAELNKLFETHNQHGHILFTEDSLHMEKCMASCALLEKGWYKTLKIKLKRGLEKVLMYRGEGQ